MFLKSLGVSPGGKPTQASKTLKNENSHYGKFDCRRFVICYQNSNGEQIAQIEFGILLHLKNFSERKFNYLANGETTK